MPTISGMSNGPSILASADSAAERMNLLVSLSCFCTACCTLGWLKRARTLMMCSRATGSLPSILAIKSSTEDSSATSPMILNSPFLSLGLLGIGGIQQFAYRVAAFLGGDHVEQGLLGHPRLGQGVQQRVRGIVLARRQRPRDARHGAAVGLGHGLQQGSAGSWYQSGGKGLRRTPWFRVFPRWRAHRRSDRWRPRPARSVFPTPFAPAGWLDCRWI